jgi:hypothetical protein
MNQTIFAAVLAAVTFTQVVLANPPEFAFRSPAAFSRLLEERWSIAAIQRFCTPARRHNDAYQNLVPDGPVWEGRLYPGRKTGFDEISWYADTKRGRIDNYSLGVSRGNDFWLLEIGDSKTIREPPRTNPDLSSEPSFVGHK